MSSEDIQQEFNGFVKLMQSLVRESIDTGVVKQDFITICKQTVMEHGVANRGMGMPRTMQQYISKPVWFKATWIISTKVKTLGEFQIILEKLSTFTGKNVAVALSQAVNVIIDKLLSGENLIVDELLDFLLKEIAEIPVLAWTDVDVYGLILKDVKNFIFTIGNRRFVFRQLEVADFEWEIPIPITNSAINGIISPSAILKIEMLGSRPYEYRLAKWGCGV